MTSFHAHDPAPEARACHIRDVDHIISTLHGIDEQHGRLDILVNNAAAHELLPA